MCVWNGANLALENVKTWYWTGSSEIYSVDIGDVNGDGKTEIVTGGSYLAPYPTEYAQLCVWDGSSLTLDNCQTWKWAGNTCINSVAIGDVNGKMGIITGGYIDYNGGSSTTQLCVWDGATLALKDVKTWVWSLYANINSVAVGDLNNDGKQRL